MSFESDLRDLVAPEVKDAAGDERNRVEAAVESLVQAVDVIGSERHPNHDLNDDLEREASEKKPAAKAKAK
jgi:hypothetical protein